MKSFVSCPDVSQEFCVYKDIKYVLQEIQNLIEEEGHLVIKTGEMTEEEYNNLPEFDGY